ncbi:MAG TPA: Gfo/Idh/MocA family oxidoreductase [Bacteroidetes bacterium]|nr:Gfo/Idh/MocA family oxidoreductase [Bacteroidota bacterium]
MDRKIKWGIIGLGKIANKFAEDLLLSDNSILYGVASRSLEKAKEFGNKYKAVKYFDSYEALASDSEIDVVYIATPHTLHFENTMLCLRNGKNVLCEKPMGINLEEVTTMVKEARDRNLFLMEAMWTRFIPSINKMLELIKAGLIGGIVYIKADFGFKGDNNLESRVYSKALGGGSLLDIGIYPVYLSMLLQGSPEEIKAMARWTDTGVDSFCAMLFDHKNSSKSILESTIEADTPTEAYIFGTKGTIRIHSRFHHPEKLTLIREEEEVYNLKIKGNGYFYEIEEVENCLFYGKKESDKHSLEDSLKLMEVIDRIKEKIGLCYKNKN